MEKAIVAIDFGTSGTTYAFAFYDSKDDIIHANWPDSPDLKNSTEIILNEKMETIKFGNECQKYLGELSSTEEKFYHFTDIKMKLYKYNNKAKIKATNHDFELDIEIIISKILIFIKTEALKEIQSLKDIKESEINWKVTVPAIWDNNSKEIMKKASIIAGIFSEPLTFFALEPEAAACDYVNEKTSNKESIKEGNKYIVCDIGGGTVDISTHTRIKNGDNYDIEEIYPPCGGDHGSTYINKAFIEKVIKQIFGKHSIDRLNEIMNNPQLDKEIYNDYCELLEEIENFKINIKHQNLTKRGNNEAKRINCTLFENLVESDINTLINNYNKNCQNGWMITNYSKYKIYFPYQIMIDLTNEIIIDYVIKNLKNILKHIPDIQSIIYAGSVSSNDFIISKFKENIPEVNHYRSAYPSKAVAEGAVIFGFDPYIIKSRISKFTIGINVKEKWNESLHGKRNDLKYFDKIDNCYFCKNIFSPIILKNQKVGINEIISQKYIMKSSKGVAKFYKTIYNNVIFIDEKSTKTSKKKLLQFGEIRLDVGNSFDINKRDVVVELYLGGTFIDAKIKYKNIEKNGVFDFSKEE